MPDLYVTVHVPRWRARVVRVAIGLYKFAAWAGLHRPTVREVRRVTNSLAGFMVNGARFRKRTRVRVV